MDDHFPAGFYHVSSHPTIYHNAPSPWGIPFRALISENIENLCFAGRNISVTHAALSSSRVMATCAILGQALGTAVAQAVNTDTPLDKIDIELLRDTLMFDDCWLPFTKRKISALTAEARLSHPVLANGYDRPIGSDLNSAMLEKGEAVTFEFDGLKNIKGVRLIFDSNLERREKNMPCAYPLDLKGYDTPATLVKDFRLIFHTENGDVTYDLAGNYQRFVIKDVDIKADRVTFIPLETYGAEKCNVFSIDIL